MDFLENSELFKRPRGATSYKAKKQSIDVSIVDTLRDIKAQTKGQRCCTCIKNFACLFIVFLIIAISIFLSIYVLMLDNAIDSCSTSFKYGAPTSFKFENHSIEAVSLLLGVSMVQITQTDFDAITLNYTFTGSSKAAIAEMTPLVPTLVPTADGDLQLDVQYMTLFEVHQCNQILLELGVPRKWPIPLRINVTTPGSVTITGVTSSVGYLIVNNREFGTGAVMIHGCALATLEVTTLSGSITVYETRLAGVDTPSGFDEALLSLRSEYGTVVLSTFSGPEADVTIQMPGTSRGSISISDSSMRTLNIQGGSSVTLTAVVVDNRLKVVGTAATTLLSVSMCATRVLDVTTVEGGPISAYVSNSTAEVAMMMTTGTGKQVVSLPTLCNGKYSLETTTGPEPVVAGAIFQSTTSQAKLKEGIIKGASTSASCPNVEVTLTSASGAIKLQSMDAK
ncbi:hypothetical protein PAPYR_2021 [Paratrimastix pyriformis]|uniref:Adhesin domain-containing protein n=1 Tax=Paratrimastix pyriformis TaxID=342808 RepID=A0ABQ8USE1_9EUKA|nr:hypothetical protein PAPYR_2021 [Paratrimastix pyriformis]